MQPVATTLPTEVTTSVPVVETSVAVTAQRMDSTKILIMYKGGLDADHLRELETKGISSKGSAMIRSMGSRLDPRQYREVEPISFRDPTRKRHMS